jgi:hypothetical protein
VAVDVEKLLIVPFAEKSRAEVARLSGRTENDYGTVTVTCVL